MKKIVVLILVCFFLSIPILSQTQNRSALLVGVSDYQDLALGDLKTAKNDALGLTKALFSNGSFRKIRTLVREGNPDSFPNRYNIITEFEAIVEESKEEDILLFYFSGHGVIDYNDRVYLLPEDADPKRPFESGIALEQLLRIVSKAKAKRVLFLLDACRNPSDGRNEEGKSFLEPNLFRSSELVSVFFSTKLGFSSFEDSGSGYGIFTKYLIYGLEGRADANFNGEITYSELTNYVITSVRDWSKANQKLQRPYTKEFAEKSEDIVLSFAINPEVSLADAPLFNPYNPTFAFRSFVFPGWGQYARGQEKKGKAFMGLFAFSVAVTGYYYVEYERNAKAYESIIGIPPNPRVAETILVNYALLEPARVRMEESRERLSQSLGLLFFVWSANLFDFYLFGSNPKEKTGVSFDIYRESVGWRNFETVGRLGYTWQF